MRRGSVNAAVSELKVLVPLRRALAWLLTTLPILAWAAPDAGSVLQQLEARPGGALVAPKLKKSQEPTPPAGDHGGPVVHIEAFRIEGQSLVSEPVLQAALAGFTQRDLSLTQLQEAAWVLVQTYREVGWLVHAIVPQQEIEDGVVTLRVIEARLDRVRMEFPEGGRLPRSAIEAMVAAHLKSGQFINLEKLDRLVLLLDDMPGVQASASFAEGRENGSTDVLIQLAQEKPLDANFSIDNFGAVSTGARRLSANLNVNNPAGLADGLQLQALRTDGSGYGRLSYTLPVGLQGARVGLHATDMRYHLVGNFAALQASGAAVTWGADLSAALIRQADRNLSLQLTTDRKRFDNVALADLLASGATTVSRYRVDVLRAGLTGNWLDQVLTPGQNILSLQATWGRVDLRDSPNEGADARGANTAGQFSKLNASYLREQNFTLSAIGYLQASAQWAKRNLDSSEKFYLGGVAGLRAYPSNEGGGSAGALVTAGLRLHVGEAFTFNPFADWGRVALYQNNLSGAGEALSNLNRQSLRGMGLALAWRSAQGNQLAATLSRRRGANPAANPNTGADSDGTLTMNRLWFSATLNY